MALTTNRGQENYTQSQKKAYAKCLTSFNGLSHKEAERVLLDLLDGIKKKAIIKL